MPRGRHLPSLLAQATSRTSEGASLLFQRLDAGNTRPQQGAEVLARLSERLRAGVWNGDIAELIARAEAIEKALGEEEAE